MGVAASGDINWSHPPPVGRDYWGKVPPQLRPSQHQWSELFVDGIPPFHSSIYPREFFYTSLKPNVPTYFGAGGQGRDIMQTFGVAINGLQNGGMAGDINEPANAAFPQANDRAWPPPQGDPNVCTPENYPNCNMQVWRDQNDKQPVPWSSFWAMKATSVMDNNQTVHMSVEPLGTRAAPVNLPERWNNMVNSITSNYLSGGLDALEYVNTKNTAGFDPCAGAGFFEMFLPIAAGVVSVAVPTKLGVLDILRPQIKTVAQLSLALLGYDAGKVTMLGVDDRATRYKEKAATVLTWGGGAVLADLGISFAGLQVQQPALSVAYLASGFLVNRLLYDVVLTVIKPASWGLGLLGALLGVLDWFGRVWCRLQNWGYNACDDVTNFEDARKWDIASIAAQITDRAADMEGWGKEDPRREFVYRGLITGPAMLGAAAVNPVPGIFGAHPTNPLGSWMQVHTNIGQATYQRGDFWNVFNGEYSSITGQDEEPGFAGYHNAHTRYACNNIDVILQALENEADKTQDPSGETSVQTDDDVRLASRLNPVTLPNPDKSVVNWTQTLIAMARDPNNIRKQGEIPGMQGSQAPKFDYDVETYLRTCMNDFEHKAGEHYGTGFNHVKQRGQYVFAYESERAKGLRLVETPRQALLEANACFGSFDSESAALDYWQERKVKDKNIAMAVQYWHEPKGDAQRWTFDNNWRSKSDPRVAHYLAMEVAAFEFPFTEPYATTPLQPAQHTPMHGLLPAQHTHLTHLLPTHMQPLPGPQTFSSQQLLGYLELELMGSGWNGVVLKFKDMGISYPTQYSRDVYFDITRIYYAVAVEGAPIDVAVEDKFLEQPDKASVCALAEAVLGHAPVLFGKMSNNSQAFVRLEASNNC